MAFASWILAAARKVINELKQAGYKETERPKEATSKRRKASPENRVRKFDKTLRQAEYRERNAKENNKGHK